MKVLTRLVVLLMSGAGLLGSPAWARCPRACSASLNAGYRTCRAACVPAGPGRGCRSACKAERRAEKATCRAAKTQEPPGCGLADLYVATSSSLGAIVRGSLSQPYRRITDAVVRARAERTFGALPPDEEIRIHVAPGTYVGSYDPAQLQAHAEYEVLPIILNVPGLTLLGGTILVRDERGLPTAAASGSETILEPDKPLGQLQYLLLVTRTADGAAGNSVTVDGFVLDGIAGDLLGADVSIDRVSSFRFSNNVVRRSGFGVSTRLASGTIEGNLLADNLELGSGVSGGSLAQPATVLIHANRATRNAAHGFGHAVAGWVKLPPTDPGQNSLALLEPLQTVFDRNNPEDVRNIPDTLTVTLSGNDASDNGDSTGCCGGTGIRLVGIWPPYAYDTADTSQPVTSVLTAHVSGNTFERNVFYGVVLEAGATVRTYPRRFIQTLTVDLDGNTFVGNGRAPALFTFIYWLTSVGPAPAGKKFAEDSSYTVTDGDGELAGFDYDNPVVDPISGTVLNNTLTVNGVEIPHGKSITPFQ